MQFLDPLTELPIKACLQFKHNGYIVSISNMFKQCEILAWNDSGKTLKADTIPEIINKIDQEVY